MPALLGSLFASPAASVLAGLEEDAGPKALHSSRGGSKEVLTSILGVTALESF